MDIYAAVAASLAERKRGGQLTEFFKNIKGTIHDDDWDEVLLPSSVVIAKLDMQCQLYNSLAFLWDLNHRLETHCQLIQQSGSRKCVAQKGS